MALPLTMLNLNHWQHSAIARSDDKQCARKKLYIVCCYLSHFRITDAAACLAYAQSLSVFSMGVSVQVATGCVSTSCQTNFETQINSQIGITNQKVTVGITLVTGVSVSIDLTLCSIGSLTASKYIALFISVVEMRYRFSKLLL